MIIVVEGCDKVGKNSLIKELHRQTNFKHICINRFIGSHIVYGRFRHRHPDYKEYFEYDKELSKLPFVKQVILIASKKDLIERFKEHNETDIREDEIATVLTLYENYSKQTKLPTLVLDTSKNTINECIFKILKFIEN